MKNKKILAIGLAGMLTLGVASGCNFAQKDLSEEQINNIMYALDNTKAYFDESLTLIKLENAQKSAKEAYELYQLAKANLIFNNDKIKDNLVIKDNFSYVEEQENYEGFRYYYRDDSGEYYYSNDGDSYEELRYVKDGSVYRYYVEGSGESKDESISELGETTVSASINNRFDKMIFGEEWNSFSEENIIDVRVNEEGNYVIVFLRMETKNEYYESWGDYYSQENSYTELVITPDAKFVKLVQKSYTSTYNSDLGPSNVNHHTSIIRTLDFEYGAVEKDIIFDCLDRANAFAEND